MFNYLNDVYQLYFLFSHLVYSTVTNVIKVQCSVCCTAW